jgi:hypothetical protein
VSAVAIKESDEVTTSLELKPPIEASERRDEDLAPRRLTWRKKSVYIPSYIQSYLPYIISPDYSRLVKLVRYRNRSLRWHSRVSQNMIAGQCERLHLRVYGCYCYYGASMLPHLPSYLEGEGIVEGEGGNV